MTRNLLVTKTRQSQRLVLPARAPVTTPSRRSRDPVLLGLAQATTRLVAVVVCELAGLQAHLALTRRACRNGHSAQRLAVLVQVVHQGVVEIGMAAVAARTALAHVQVVLAAKAVPVAPLVAVDSKAAVAVLGAAQVEVAPVADVADPVVADVQHVGGSRSVPSAKSSTTWQHRLSVRPQCPRARANSCDLHAEVR